MGIQEVFPKTDTGMKGMNPILTHMIPDADRVILQAILAIPVALVLFVALVLLVMSELEKRRG